MEQNYKKLLIDAVNRFEELSKEIAKLGDKYVSVYNANILAHKADMEMHIILKAMGKGKNPR